MTFWKKQTYSNDVKLGRYWGSLTTPQLAAIVDSARATAGDLAWNSSLLIHVAYNGADWEPVGKGAGMSVVGGSGGVAATDIVAIDSYDATTGFPKVKSADATIATSLLEDLWFAPVAIAAGAKGTVVKGWTGVLTSSLAGYTAGDTLYLSATAGDVTNAAYANATERNIQVGQVLVAATSIAHIDLGAAEQVIAHTHANVAEGGALGALTSPVMTTPEINNPALTYQYIITGGAILADRIANLPVLGGTDTFVFADFAQTLTNKTLTSPVLTTPQINNAAATFQYVFVASALAADRNVTLPLLAGDDTFVFADFIQTLTNKTLTSPVLTTPEINNLASTFQYVVTPSAILADRIVTLPALGAGDTFVFADFIQTLTNKTLTSPVLTIPEINNLASTYQYVVTPSAIAADRVVTLPLLAGADTFVFADFIQTLAGKTLTSPVLSTGVSGTAVDVDGALAANSATLIAPQSAVKTYVDTRRTKIAQYQVADLVAGADISARPIFVSPTAITLVSATILTEGASAGVDDANTAVITVADASANAIVTKTYNTATQPPNTTYGDLGALSGTHKILTANEAVTFSIAQGATADLPAFSIVLEYYIP